MNRALPDRMPAIFFGHGSPMNALRDNRYTESWKRLAASLPRPKAILAISAHWVTRGTAVTAMAAPPTIHDFGNFPQALFDVQYPALGDPLLAARVCDLLAPIAVKMDHAWGLDHGTWSILLKAYPAADVPVIQLSMDAALPLASHYELGRRLTALRDEGVLLMGSGNVVHNLRMLAWDDAPAPHDWAVRFNHKVRDSLLRGDAEALIHYARWGIDATLSVPTAEHFLPLLYVLGSRADDEAVAIAVDGIERGSIGMLSAVIGDTRGTPDGKLRSGHFDKAR